MHAIIYENPSLGPCVISVRNLKESGITFTEIVVDENNKDRKLFKLPLIEFYKGNELIDRHYGVIDVATVRHIVNVYGK